MPEGDTIFRIARELNAALAGQKVVRFETVLPRLARVDDQTPLSGRTIEGVRAAGKHLIVSFSGDLALHTHLRMNGSWHLYRTGERWRRRRSDMRLAIVTDDFVAIGFNIPVAEFRSERDLTRQPALRRMGPDLLGPRFDVAETVRRMRERAGDEIGNVLLDQRVLAGIGNIYKSEILFACGVNPFATVESLSEERLRRIVTRGQAMLRLGSEGRPPHAVYSRGGQPCRRCGSAVSWRRQGAGARSTYWCPRCQP